MTATEDLELLRQYAAYNSEEAFTTLVSRHVNLVYSVALRRLGDVHLAEEVTQATFIILARKAGSLSPKTILPAWLCRTAQYVASGALRTQLRRQRREQELYMQSSLDQSESKSDSESSPWPDIAPLLDVAMAGLNEKDHSAIVLRYFQGQDLKLVGAALGVSENAAKTRVSRAVEKLRRFFLKRNVTLSAAALAGAVAANSVQAAPPTLAKSVTAAAITKGATASGSTLSLIKAGLKLMSWAKAKLALITSGVILLGAGVGMTAVESAHLTSAAVTIGPDIQGTWEGVTTLEANGIDLPGVRRGEKAHTRIVFRIEKTNGNFTAIADEIDLGIRNVETYSVHYDYPNISFSLGPWGRFEGKLNADATQMTFRIGDEFDVYSRTNTPDSVPERLTESDFASRGNFGLQGWWKGRIGRFVGGPEGARITCKIAGQSGGTYRGEMDRPTLYLGANHWPVVATLTESKVTIKPLTGAGMFQGKLNDAGTEMSGTWYEGGHLQSMVLARADYEPESTPPESAYSFTSPTDLQGHWSTTATLNFGPPRNQPLELDIAKLSDGTFSSALTLPACSLIGMGEPLPTTNSNYQLPNLRLEWKPINAVFDGKLSDGKLTGKWTQNGASTPLIFQRSATQ